MRDVLRPPMRRGALGCVLALLVLLPLPLGADVVRVVVESRVDVLGGRAWADAGAYERLSGKIYFAFDPENAANAMVVDLDMVPRNGEGRVEAWADFVVYQPKDPALRRGIGWVEVSNRGGKASFSYFNRGRGGGIDPTTAEHFGDGLLFEEGLTLIWVGWQWDVPDVEGLVRLHVPVARAEGGESIFGLVRSDWVVDAPTEVLSLSHRDHRTYPAVEPDHDDHVLTVRDGREAERQVVPRELWRFEASAEGLEAGRLTHVRLEGGFEAGRIYEMVYRSRDPRVVGLGLTAVRDITAYAKYDLRSEFPVQQAVGFGVSQTGRFLRHFIYQGFNVDEEGRQVFDGLLVHTAGAGRGSFNHRFGQASRDGHAYSAFFYPTDLYPFTSRAYPDPETGWNDGLFERTPESSRPKTFYTNTGYEYWGRAASLIHTTPDGIADARPHENERIYLLASAQHYYRDAWTPPSEDRRITGMDAYRGSPLDHLATLRALGIRLIEWVESDAEPPPHSHPLLADGTLVQSSGVAWPEIPGLSAPASPHVAYRADYGPRWDEGIVNLQPPELGAPYPVHVPQVDGIGNELAGLRALEIMVPLGTYLPWSLRVGAPGGADAIANFEGMFVPLPTTDAAAQQAGDPRPSLEALYGDRTAFLARVDAAARYLVSQGRLLERDRARMVRRQESVWDWLQERDRN